MAGNAAVASGARASRAAFFIFDPTLVPEGDGHHSEEDMADAKMIYYSPSCVALEEKRSQIGLIEGLIAFTSMFETKTDSKGKPRPLRSIRTKQYLFSILEAEPNIWLVLIMRHPTLQPEASRGQSELQFDEEGLGESTMQAILQNCYNVFRLLHGEVQSFVKDKRIPKLFDLLEDFIPAFLETVDVSDLGIFHELEGFHYGPVERNTCVSIHCFLDKLREQYPTIQHAALLYNAHLLYTSFALADTRVLYSYLVSFNGAVSNYKLNRPPFGRIPTAASQPGGGSSPFGRAFLLGEEEAFLLGASRYSTDTTGTGPTSLFVPTIHLTQSGAGQLVVLAYRGIMLVLIFEPGAQLDTRLLESIRLFCTKPQSDGLSLAQLHPLIAPQYAQVMEREDEYRFVYYNHTNYALRLSSQPTVSRSLLGGGRSSSAGPKLGERAALCPLHATLSDPGLRCREVSWKAADRGWICAKRWREREFYLMLDGASTSLSRCQEEFARFASIHFSNIFMM